jgi:hypothetical protein
LRDPDALVNWDGTVVGLDVLPDGIVVTRDAAMSETPAIRVTNVRRGMRPWRVSLICDPGGRVSIMPFRDGERSSKDVGKPAAEGPAAWGLKLSEPDPITQALAAILVVVAALCAPALLWWRVRRIAAASELRRTLARIVG